ncbi:MAG: 2-oxoacid:acceptor oxidoreductase subunit alpha [Bdellovibrionales bacterium]|nr:2-oxoacid:acceptor oxidoreductase subunit alpha [Bdellovibrionales bacterium]
MKTINDFSITIGTINGSGSQSSNNILVRTLFHMGLPVSGKNLFPSNIAGLPTWFTIRISAEGHLSRKDENDIVIGMNADSLIKDQNSTKKSGVFIYNIDLKVPLFKQRDDILCIPIPFKQIVNEVSDSIKLKKLLTNMIYVGVISQLLGIDIDVLHKTIQKNFSDKPQVIDINVKAINAGWEYAEKNLDYKTFPYKVKFIENANDNKILIDGNTASAIGLLFGGCSFMSWYPITPSSSVAEMFHAYSNKYRKTTDGKNNFAIVQAEDELAAISMVIGAGWTGARAVTPTSGPGLSLMAEAAGLSYFAEVPAVIWDVQRVGPSTGLPTRTMQGDLLAAYHLSHGDTKHIVLLPANPNECYEFGKTSLDLAERLQTLVVVLSDLDLGMNYWISDRFQKSQEALDRGKVYREDDLIDHPEFARYQDVDGDGIPYRTLPGTYHPKAAYFTRGTGHDERALYSEDNENFRKLMNRLAKKHETAKKYVPQPIVQGQGAIGLIAYGSSHPAVEDLQNILLKEGNATSYMRIRALPLVEEIKHFITKNDITYVIEQNRDAQLMRVLLAEWPELHAKVKSITQYDGLPLAANYLYGQFKELNS